MLINKVINSFLSFNKQINGIFLTIVFSVLVYSFSYAAADSTLVVYKVDVKEEIGPGIARKLGKALDEATALKADLVIVHMNTYGGLLDAADSIRTRLLNFNIPVVAFIDNNAASAGALISIACNRIYMRSGASIGAATVVDQNATALPDKYQSYMRAMMRSTAEKRGRNPLIAEAMVDPRTYIPNVNDSGKVLTFTTSEAIKNGYCEGQKETVEEVIAAEGLTNYILKVYTPSFIDNIISLLINPAVSGILLLIMLGGIYFELQTPGIGFPLFAAVLAAILYFAPLYIEGLAANWEILMAVFGFILLAVEILVLPGFGVAGVLGILLLVFSFSLSMIGNDGFNFESVPAGAVSRAFTIVIISMFSSIVLSFLIGKRILKTERFGRMVLKTSMAAADGYVSSDTAQMNLIGATGHTQSFLRPSGKVLINGLSYSANAENGFIEAGKNIEVTRFDGINIWVVEQEKLDS
jgi:membrane-bound serine protease (ClpP class)